MRFFKKRKRPTHFLINLLSSDNTQTLLYPQVNDCELGAVILEFITI